MVDLTNPFQIKVLMVYDGINENNADAHAIKLLRSDLEEKGIKVVTSESEEDAASVINSDPTVQCVLLKIDEKNAQCCTKAGKFLHDLRARNQDLPVFLMSARTLASDVPTDVLDKVNDFIWILEDTADFISGRILAAVARYREFILPPMFKALAKFSKVHEYSWHTPGHTGGTAFLKAP